LNRRVRDQALCGCGEWIRPRFDLSRFHDALLENGLTPRPILEPQVERRVAAAGRQGRFQAAPTRFSIFS
jgi:uncharacterized protein (DUF885 family)